MSEIVPGVTDAAVKAFYVPVWAIEYGIIHVKGRLLWSIRCCRSTTLNGCRFRAKQDSQLGAASRQKPEDFFALNEGDEVEEVFAYCNLPASGRRQYGKTGA